MKGARLIYLPLGGAGEVGMNAYVYGYGPEGKERLILVDCGVSFGDTASTPGVELVLPDLTWLAERASRIEAIFITHAHEDHIGALPWLWPRLKAPIHARRFTAHIGRLKFEEAGLPREAIQVVEARPATVVAGPFRVGFLPVAHSLPESAALVIDTPAGRVLHTADFKLDPSPVIGDPWDPAAWAAVAAEVAPARVRAMVCDSTNVLVEHPGRSETAIAPAIAALVASREGLVVATTFASNVARLKTLADAAVASGRAVCLLGRAMKRMVQAATETGLLAGFPPTVTPEEAAAMPRHRLMLLATGSQGERRAAVAQLARGRYLGLSLAEGDLVLFSSKTIPGNERDVLRLVNAFSEMGVDVVDEQAGAFHISGHANRPDLATVQDLVRPAMVIPMHGEHRHLRAHARMAQGRGFASEIVTNGMMAELAGEAPEIVEYIEAGRLYLDGSVLVGAADGVMRDRIRMALNGVVLVTLIIDEDGAPLGEAWVETLGLPGRGRGGGPLAEAIEAELARVLERAGRGTLADDDKLDEAMRRVVRQVAMEEIGKKPEVTVVVSRLMAE